MEHKEILDEMNSDMLSSAVRTVCQIYDNMKRENLIKWIEENPDYWRDFCKLETGEITPEYAEKIMMSLVNSNILD